MRRRKRILSDARLRYEPMRPAGGGWSFRLRVERLAPDGEWEPVLVRDHRIRNNDVLGDPSSLTAFEKRTAREAGYDWRNLDVVDMPTFA